MAEESRIPSTGEFEANGRRYRPPARPIAVICIDGCADEYLDVSIARGVMPHLLSMSVRGYRGMARAALPCHEPAVGLEPLRRLADRMCSRAVASMSMAQCP